LKKVLIKQSFRYRKWTYSLQNIQGGHSSGKPGKVRELKSGQGKVRENGKSQGKVRENELSQLLSCREYS